MHDAVFPYIFIEEKKKRDPLNMDGTSKKVNLSKYHHRGHHPQSNVKPDVKALTTVHPAISLKSVHPF